MNGAEPVNPETMQRFTERFSRYGFRNETHLPVYGLAESSLAVTVAAAESRTENRSRRSRNIHDARSRAFLRTRRHELSDFLRFIGRFAPRTRSSSRRCARQRSARAHGRFSLVSRTIGDHGLLSQRSRDAKIVAAGTRKIARRIRVGRFRRSRVSRRGRVLHHRPRQRHHHQGRPQSLSSRSRRTRCARRWHSQRLHRRFWFERRSVGHGKTNRRCGSARSRSEKASADFRRGHRANFARARIATRSRRTGAAGQHSQDIKRKTAPRRNAPTFQKRIAVASSSAGLGANRTARRRRSAPKRWPHARVGRRGARGKFSTASTFPSCF